jgi:hypothetical protein
MKKFLTLFALLLAFLYLMASTVSEKIIYNSLRITVMHVSFISKEIIYLPAYIT